jgi:hypothetical protein
MLPSGIVVDDDRGRSRLSVVKPGVLELRQEGAISYAFTVKEVPFADQELQRHGSLVMFIDTWEQKSVDTTTRDEWARWSKNHKNEVRSLVLVRSRLIDMTVSLIVLFAGNRDRVTICSDVETYERKCREHAPEYRRVPIAPLSSGSEAKAPSVT